MLDALPPELQHRFSPDAVTGETLLLNLGPQHPSTHGVLRLLVELDGEIVRNVVPDIGFLHTGVEKAMEARSYIKALVLTDRLDYLNPLGNNLAYCLAVEKLVGIEVPARAQAIRVILAELQRIASHLVWLGSHTAEVGVQSITFYTFRERERLLELFEAAGGQRLMTSFIRPGGLWRDLPAGFTEGVEAYLGDLPAHLNDYERLLTRNPIWLDRTRGIGAISAENALAWGLTGPSLRASGVNFDLRKAMPYSGYEQYDFDVPLGEHGDVYDRYQVRTREFRESLRIVRQALKHLPGGPVLTGNRKFVPPPRSELGHSMEALIHHYKYWTEGFSAPKGEVYQAVESPRGELGVFLAGNGGPKPHRVHWRTPSFASLQCLPVLGRSCFLADLLVIGGSLDLVMGDVDR